MNEVKYIGSMCIRQRSRPMWLFLLVRVTADPSPGLSGCGSPPPDTRSVTEVLGGPFR
jgi:hypothetical protein